MSDDIPSPGTEAKVETPEAKEAPVEPEKKYTEADIQREREAAKKAGQTESYRHFQSIADKQIAAAADKARREAIAEMKREQLKSLGPDEQVKAMVEEMYNSRFSGEGTTPVLEGTPSQPQPTASPDDAGVQEARQRVADTLRREGLDPEKVNWGDDLDPDAALSVFIKSVVEQITGKKESPKEPEGEEEPLVNASRSAGGVVDILKADPVELIKSQGFQRIRGTFNE